MQSKIETIKNLLTQHHQQHLLKFFDELSNQEKENLLNQIESIDFDLITSLYKDLVKQDEGEIDCDLQPLKAHELDAIEKEEKAELYQIGIDKLKEGKVAALLLAGGQGTRLGHEGPKGTFDIGLPSHKSLFQLQCEGLTNLSSKCGRYIDWYIMTSFANHEETISFFEEHGYFGYPKEKIRFFSQGMLPAIDEFGKIILEEKSQISMAPNGNGGCFIALRDEGILQEMKQKGIEWIFLYGVDNALVKVVDPYFIGFTSKTGLSSASKVVAKKSPTEKAGVLCYRNGQPDIVEYSELPQELAEKVDDGGNLIFDNANIANHLLKLEYVEKFLSQKTTFHVAHKKIPYVNEEGIIEHPDTPNGYKFESFIFDIFSCLPDMAALKVKREEEFAPVKNKDGEDSPFTARQLILDLHKNWLIEKGISSELLDGKTVEISPLTSYYGENIIKDEVVNKLLGSDILII